MGDPSEPCARHRLKHCHICSGAFLEGKAMRPGGGRSVPRKEAERNRRKLEKATASKASAPTKAVPERQRFGREEFHEGRPPRRRPPPGTVVVQAKHQHSSHAELKDSTERVQILGRPHGWLMEIIFAASPNLKELYIGYSRGEIPTKHLSHLLQRRVEIIEPR